MTILGIDPGLKTTGYGFIIFKNQTIRLLETGTINPKRRDLIQNRVNKVYKILGDLITQYKPDCLVLEKLYTHYHYPTTAGILGHVRGVICLLCAQKNVPLVEYPVKRIRKALTGNGNASKLQTQRVVAQILKINEQQLTLDASDALALALGFIHMHSRKI